eukprot:11212839-Lingulodinium_polyedra.AAC.1
MAGDLKSKAQHQVEGAALFKGEFASLRATFQATVCKKGDYQGQRVPRGAPRRQHHTRCVATFDATRRPHLQI